MVTSLWKANGMLIHRRDADVDAATILTDPSVHPAPNMPASMQAAAQATAKSASGTRIWSFVPWLLLYQHACNHARRVRGRMVLLISPAGKDGAPHLSRRMVLLVSPCRPRLCS